MEEETEWLVEWYEECREEDDGEDEGDDLFDLMTHESALVAEHDRVCGTRAAF